MPWCPIERREVSWKYCLEDCPLAEVCNYYDKENKVVL